jgi:conjugative relaxase-like TrwC/TraI family protein
MLFISHRSNAQEAKDYFTRDLARADYYLKDAPEVAGQWHGLGAELLGLEGEVKQEDFFALCDNLNPESGERLTPRMKADRRVLYDFTFDAPKSVTLAYEIGRDERIRGAFEESVAETMGSMEGAVMARVRKGGKDEDRATANLVWASFVHRTTRPVDGVPDPQLHAHAVAFNATYDTVEEKWKAAQFGNLVQHKGFYQAEFHSRLAGKLSDLGYGIERDGNSFRLAGIERATSEKFSRRTAVIEAEAERLGITDAKAKGELGRKTREKKDKHGKSISQLRAAWQARLGDEERRGIIEARRGGETTTLSAGAAMDYALSHSFERASVVPEKELLKTALIHSVGNASVKDIKAESLREGVIKRERGGQILATTREVLNEEIAMTRFAREGRGRHRKLGGDNLALDAGLSEEQQKAARVILESRDRVSGLIGSAGTGKTRMMQATVAAIKQSGKEVFAFAPSAEASRGVLRSEGFANAETVERLLIDPKMQDAVHGQVLWVDEAGLLSVKDMKRLFDVAKDKEARVILSGDAKQHFSVGRGDALRMLERDAGMKFAQLNEVRRQADADYRRAVTAISEGDRRGKDGRTRLEAGMEMLDRMGAIVEAEGEGRFTHIAQDYAAVTRERKKDGKFKTALVVSPTHREGEQVTQAVRKELKASGRLGQEERDFLSLKNRGLTEAERGDTSQYRPGDLVQFVQNAKGYRRGERVMVKEADAGGVVVARADGSSERLALREASKFQVYERGKVVLAKGDRLRISQNGFTRKARGLPGNKGKDRLNNGAVYEVAGFTKGGDIKLSNGFVVQKDYGGLTHGYVVTSHASQGKTVDKVLVALGSESLAAANREQFYVSVSRGREAVRLYTDDKAAMMDTVKHSSARLSASELMDEAGVKPRTPSSRRLFGLQHIHRAYAALRDRLAARVWAGPRREGMGLGH